MQRLSRDAIVAAALQVIDERGLDAVSMRAVASRLDCEAMSLYRHVADKAHLLSMVGEAVTGEIRLPSPDVADWQQTLRELFTELRRVALRHPDAFVLVSQGPITAVGAGVLDTGMRALLAGGLAPDRAARTLCTLLAFATGAIGNELAALRVGSALARAADENDPAWANTPEAAAFVRLMQQASYADEFAAGLDLLLAACRSGPAVSKA